LQVGAGRGEVRVPQLASDQRQWNPLTQQLDSVGMAELMVVPDKAVASGVAVRWLGPVGCRSAGVAGGERVPRVFSCATYVTAVWSCAAVS